MNLFQAAFLGVIQGITEFLPVSSSGHLIFLPKLFGWSDNGLAFDTVIHLGTLVAVTVYFRKKFWLIINSLFRKKEYGEQNLEYRKLGWLILLSVIPAAVTGFFFGGWLENTLRSAGVVGFSMIFWGLILYIADAKGKKNLDKLSWKKSLFIGCAQAIALIPGTSRSGIVMTAGLFSKLSKESAVEFSFLMSAPIIFLAGASQFFKLASDGLNEPWPALAIGLISAAIGGLIAIDVLLKIVKSWSFLPFVAYRVILGILILVFLL